MTKQHFEMIAGLIRQQLAQIPDTEDSEARAALYRFARDFAREAYLTNHRFDAKRFLAACGLRAPFAA